LLSGMLGQLKLNEEIIPVKDWEVNMKSDILDSTDFSNEWQKKVSNIKGFTGKTTGFLTELQIAYIELYMDNHEPFYIKFYYNTDDYILGLCHVDALKESSIVNGLCEVELNLIGDGSVFFGSTGVYGWGIGPWGNILWH
jgi:hypothetical protein